jgi:hypothetical protein
MGLSIRQWPLRHRGRLENRHRFCEAVVHGCAANGWDRWIQSVCLRAGTCGKQTFGSQGLIENSRACVLGFLFTEGGRMF